MINPALKQGIHQGLWHFPGSPTFDSNKVDTGFDALNDCLKIGGWPLTTTTEIGLHDDGIGELRLLFPALRTLLNQHQKEILWIAPPYQPNASALLKECIDISKLIVVEPQTQKDILWCMEQALIADCFSAVISWTQQHSLSQHETRRLQLASERTSAWHVQFRHNDCLQTASAAKLRLRLTANMENKLSVHVLKQPLSWAGQHCSLSLSPHYEQWRRIPTHDLPLQNNPLQADQALAKLLATSRHSKSAHAIELDQNHQQSTQKNHASLAVYEK